MDAKLRVIGQPAPRKDSLIKTTGKALYTADVSLPETQYGVLVRSPYHHARILVIHKDAALQVAGVTAVLTSKDIPGIQKFGMIPDQPVLALEETLHLGQAVALVIASTRQAAELAAKKVQVDYEELPAVLEPLEALAEGAPILHGESNLLAQFNVDSGELQSGFAAADIILEEEFSVQRISPGYMEPENSQAVCHPDGSLTVWVSSQEPFIDRLTMAAVLNLPLEKIQVLSTTIGGAFGGKEDASLSVLTAFGAWAIRGTLKLVNSRHESFLAHPKRHPATVKLKIGAKADGTLTALEGRVWMNTGAFASYGVAVGSLLTEMVTGPYRIPNVKIKTQVVYTHTPFSGAMRGFGSPQAHFAIESIMDMLAEKLGMDAGDLRRRNILQQGDTLPTRVVLNETAQGLAPCLQAALDARERLKKIPAAPGKISGVGFALAMQSMGLGAKVTDQSDHRLEWLPDGRVLIHLGAPDLGQGLATVAEQITAESLGLPFDRVITSDFDTSDVPDGGVCCASRMTYLVGNAMIKGAKALKEQLLQSAGLFLTIDPARLSYEAGQVVLPNGSRISAAEFASRAAEQGFAIQAGGSFTFPYPAASTPQHLPIGMPHVKYVFAAQVARVEVDPELGSVEVKELVAIHDLGKVINRLTAEGQIEGGVAMGIGYALYEDMPLKANSQWVDSFAEYLLPTSMDMPAHLEVQMLEYPEADGPYGAKGLAEICVVPTAPAIANAVYNAVGVRVHSLPITPEKVYKKQSQE